MKKSLLMLISTSLLLGGQAMAEGKLNYPKAKTVDTVDTYFGTAVPDPYRWLEDDNSEATAAWVEAENKVSRAYLDKIPFRAAVKKRITQLANYEKMGTPFKVNGKFYYFKNNGLQNQSVLYQIDSLGATPRVMLDPNTLSTDGTVALKSIDFSRDGRYMAYVISRNGSDWNEIFVIDVATGQQLDDHIEWAKFTSAHWLGDGFFYSAYDAPEDAKSSKNEYQKVYYHKVGTPQSQDYLEYHSEKYPLRFYSVSVSDDERYIFAYESEGHGNAIFVKDLHDTNPHYVPLVTSMEDECDPIGVDHGKIYVFTGDRPMRRIIAFDAENPVADQYTEVVPEADVVLTSARMADHHFILTYQRDASSHPAIYDLDGRKITDIELPTLGTTGFSCRNDQSEVFYSFSSFTTPGTIYSLDLRTGKSTLFFKPKSAVNPDDYTIDQVFYNSKDGTRVPMFLIYKKGLKRDGKAPAFLYGYGGFSNSITPSFTYYRFPFAMLDMGGVAAFTNLRGGDEYGEKWHQAGTKLNKQNVFDDFIAAAEYLIDNKYTNPSRLACNGASNGGLLVGAVVNQRPDLFGAAVPQVGVMDMLRYHEFTIGWNWAPDYGRSDDSPEMFKCLKDYSPLHNIKNDGTRYPAIMVTTSDHDDRVVPAHSFKYAATLQAANTGSEPKIIRIDSKAGHGAGKPISKVIDEYTDIHSFILYNLGVKYKLPKK